jgi:hypothetical protein
MTPATRQFWGGWWTNPKRVGLNVSYLFANPTMRFWALAHQFLFRNRFTIKRTVVLLCGQSK